MNMHMAAFLILCGMVLVIVFVLFWHPQRRQATTRNLDSNRRSNVIFRGDDRYWNAGFFYNNPDDPDLFVPKRFGLGWTLNFGHPQARLFVIGISLLLIVVLILPLLVGGPSSQGCHTFGCQP